MKKILLMLFLFVSLVQVNGQIDTVGGTEEILMQGDEGNNDTQIIENTDDVFTVVEQMPEFPGGQAAMDRFLGENLNYPTKAKSKGIQGKVWASFIVDKDGTVRDVEIIKGIGYGCDEEVIRVIKLMPKWTPGYQSGKAVIVKFRFPINFTLR